MNPRLASAVPVLPAVAHALALRWAAADLSDEHPFWAEVGDVYRVASYGPSAFAAALTLVAVFPRPSLARRLGPGLVSASLLVQVLWLVFLGLLAHEDLTEQGRAGSVEPVIVYTELATAVLYLAASIAALVLFYRAGGRSALTDPEPAVDRGQRPGHPPVPPAEQPHRGGHQ